MAFVRLDKRYHLRGLIRIRRKIYRSSRQKEALVKVEVLKVGGGAIANTDGVVSEEAGKKTEADDHQGPCAIDRIEVASGFGEKEQERHRYYKGHDAEDEERPEVAFDAAQAGG